MQIKNAHIRNVHVSTLQVVGIPLFNITSQTGWAGATFTGSPVDHATYKTFDGSNYLETTGIDTTSLSNNNYSYETWIRTTVSAGGVILAKLGGTGAYHVSALELNTGGYLKPGHWLGISAGYNVTGITVTRDTWQHYAVTYVDAGQMRIYINGALIDVFGIGSETSPRNYGENPMYFRMFGLETTNFGSGNPLACDFGEFRYYSRTLSDAEVLQNFTATRGRWGI